MLRNNQLYPTGCINQLYSNGYIAFTNEIGCIKIDDLRAACKSNNLKNICKVIKVGEKNDANTNEDYFKLYIYDKFQLNFSELRKIDRFNFISQLNKKYGNKLTINSYCSELEKPQPLATEENNGSGSKRILERGSRRGPQRKKNRVDITPATSVAILPFLSPEDITITSLPAEPENIPLPSAESKKLITLLPEELDHTSPFLPPCFLAPLMPESIVQPPAPANNNLNRQLPLSPQTEGGEIIEKDDPFSWLPKQANTGHHDDHAARPASSITTTTTTVSTSTPISFVGNHVGIFNTPSAQDESNQTELDLISDPSIKPSIKSLLN